MKGTGLAASCTPNLGELGPIIDADMSLTSLSICGNVDDDLDAPWLSGCLAVWRYSYHYQPNGINIARTRHHRQSTQALAASLVSISTPTGVIAT